MKCLNCHFENPDGANFCNQCGHKLEHLCSNCNSPYPGESNFCPECGNDLRKSAEVITAQKTDQLKQNVEAANLTYPTIDQIYTEYEEIRDPDHNRSASRPEVIRMDSQVLQAVPERQTSELGAILFKIGGINRLVLYEQGILIKPSFKDATLAKWDDILKILYHRTQEMYFFIPGSQYLELLFDLRDGRSIQIKIIRPAILYGVENLYHNYKIKKLFEFLIQQNIPIGPLYRAIKQ